MDERKEEIRILKKQVDKSLKKKKDIEEEIKKEKSESAKIQREVNAVEKKCEDKNNKLNVSNTLRVVLSANEFYETIIFCRTSIRRGCCFVRKWL